MAEKASTVATASVWKRFVAAALDFLSVFFIGGFAIAKLTGGMTPEGFKLDGGPAFALFALIAAYFLICRRILGGTFWDRILGIRRPQPY